MARERTGRWLRAALWLSLLALVASVSIQNIRTFDYWWHLRTGQLIVETGAIPEADPYSYTVPGNRWVDVHWLHQLGLYGLYSLGGHAAVVVAKFVLVLSLVALLGSIGYRRERAVVSVVALALMLLVAADRFMPRPELPTFVFLAAILALLHRFERRPDAWVYGIVGVQLLWTNVHGLFALGIAICAIHLSVEIIRPLVSPGEGLRRERIRRLAAVTGLSLGAAFVNPNFVDGALYPIQQLGMIGPPEDRGFFGSVVSELIPPIGGQHPLEPVAMALFLATAALSFLAMALNWRRLHAADPLMWVAFLYLALGAQRNAALFAMVAAPIFVSNLNAFLDVHPLRPRVWSVAAGLASVLIAGAVWDVARGDFYRRIGSYRKMGFGVMDVFYPVGAAEWIAREKPPGPICHHMAAGGYLIWRLYPEYKVMADGRLEVYGEEKHRDLQIPGPERFRQLDKRYGYGTVLVHHSLITSDSLLRSLYLNSNWHLTFVDDVAAVFVRVSASGVPDVPDLDIDDPQLFAPFDPSDPTRDMFERSSRTNFYRAMKRPKKALELWEGTLELYPDIASGDIVHAALLQRNGFTAAAEAILRRLLAEDPDDPMLHAQIGDIRLDSGDAEAAKAEYEAALVLDPRNLYAMYQRALVAENEGDEPGAVTLYMRVVGTADGSDPIAMYAAQRLQALGANQP